MNWIDHWPPIPLLKVLKVRGKFWNLLEFPESIWRVAAQDEQHEWVICRHCHVFIDIVAGVCMLNECDFHFPIEKLVSNFLLFVFDSHRRSNNHGSYDDSNNTKTGSEKAKNNTKKYQKAEERRDLGAKSEEKKQNAKCEYKFSQLFVCSQQLLIVNACSLLELVHFSLSLRWYFYEWTDPIKFYR